MDPVVFIHGIFQMMGELPAAGTLAPRPVFIPDMAGYGARTSVAASTITLQSQADDLARQIRLLGYEKAHIVGHSVGGAVAILLARRHPSVVASLINVEGNFTPEDAFWTGKLAVMSVEEIDALLQSYRDDARGWLQGAGIEPTVERIGIAGRGLRAQSAATVKAMAQSVIDTTSKPSYLEDVAIVLDAGIAMHLVAGERSRTGWHAPECVLRRAASMKVIAHVGHMMMIEQPEEFLKLVGALVA